LCCLAGCLVPRILKITPELGNQILRFNRKEKPLGAICAAPIVFGSLNILKGKNATCYPGNEDQLTGAQVTGNDIEVAGNIITGKGAGVAIRFALRIVEMLKGRQLADKLAEKMIFPVPASS
jgi:protein deglycase